MLRYAAVIPPSFFSMDPNSVYFKHSLKNWVKLSIQKDGDHIFRGQRKSRNIDEDDWLYQELRTWKHQEENDLECVGEMMRIEMSFD